MNKKQKESSRIWPLSFNVGGRFGGHTGKLLKICEDKSKNKVPKTSNFAGFSELFGGDKRDRTADLLNAIQRKVVVAQRVLPCLGVIWWSYKLNNF